MKTPSRAAIVMGGVYLLSACSALTLIGVPASLAPSSHERLAMIVAARGVQIYECRARPDAAASHAWTFVAPDADLLDPDGRRVGRHGAGPYWEVGDGSRIVGTVKAHAAAPVTSAIPWLLLSTTASGAPGALSRVTAVQRINTVGGTAPAIGCNEATAGAIVRVFYSADYRFFSAV